MEREWKQVFNTPHARKNKTSLINTLLGKDTAPKQGRLKKPDTKELGCYKRIVNGVEVTLWDSRGLRDGEEKDENVLQEIKSKFEEIDPHLILYCHKMDDNRLLPDDKESLKVVSSHLGDDIWARKAVIALTFADKVEDVRDPKNNVVYFHQELGIWKETIEKFLGEELGPSGNAASTIVVAPTTLRLERFKWLPKDSRPGDSGSINWLQEFWLKCYEKTKLEARLNLLHLSKGCHLTKESLARVFFTVQWKRCDISQVHVVKHWLRRW